MMTLFSTSTCNTFSTDTKIAFSFYDLGLAYERRNRIDLAIENYRKALDYDADLAFIKTNLYNLMQKVRIGANAAKTTFLTKKELLVVNN